MKDLTPKADDTVGAAGQYAAAEFNDFHDDAQTAVTESGQTLTVSTGDDTRQLIKGIAVGGKRLIRNTTETSEVGEIVLPDNGSASVTINLPPIADLFVNASVIFEPIIDQPYSTNSLVVARNSQLIMGAAEDITFNSASSDNKIVRFSWLGGSTGWTIATIGTKGTTL